MSMRLADRSIKIKTKTYGGVGGIFVKKRRSLSAETDTTDATTQSIRSTPSPTDRIRMLIGWDDVKCRPIFEKLSPSIQISDEDDDNDNGNDNDNECDNEYGMPEEEAKEDWNGRQPARKKRKAYGSRKRETFFPETATLIVVSKQNMHTSTTMPKTTPPETLTTTTNSCFPFYSPPDLNDSICDALNSTSTHKQTQNTSAPGNTDTADSNHTFVIQTDQADGMILKKRRRSVKTKKKDATQFDFVDKLAATKQPTSTTCVSKAKAFFDRLDSTQLHLDACSNTPPPQQKVHNKKCGRSNKTVDLKNHNLQQEYEAYSKASQESGVTPIALLEYANHRSDIFRRNEMFDGFLDDG